MVALSNLEKISEQEKMATTEVLDSRTVHAAEENANRLNLSTEVSMDSGKTENISSAEDTETQDTSLKQDIGEEQLSILSSECKYQLSYR